MASTRFFGGAEVPKVTTKSGHISDVEYEPHPPQLQDDLPPTDQEALDKLDDALSKKKGRTLLPTPAGRFRDRLDSLFNSRLEERIRQLQVFRTQIEDIQAKNKRDHVAKQIEMAKVVDKLNRTRERLETVTSELAEERREVRSVSLAQLCSTPVAYEVVACTTAPVAKESQLNTGAPRVRPGPHTPT
jgi:hypothetical protein